MESLGINRDCIDSRKNTKLKQIIYHSEVFNKQYSERQN